MSYERKYLATFSMTEDVVVVVHIYPPVTVQRQTLTIEDPSTFHYNDYFVLQGIIQFKRHEVALTSRDVDVFFNLVFY